MGHVLVMVKVLYLWVRRNNVFINFMCIVLLAYSYNIFIFIL